MDTTIKYDKEASCTFFDYESMGNIAVRKGGKTREKLSTKAMAERVINPKLTPSESFFRKKDFVTVEKEAVISTTKLKLFSKLADLIENEEDKEKFLRFCKNVDGLIRLWYYKEFEEFMELYFYFDPMGGNTLLEKQKLSNTEIEALEDKFLRLFLKIMEKSNFKLLTDKEFEIATSGQYLIDLPIDVDTRKLDSDMLSRFLKKTKIQNLPHYASHYLIFRRGVGMDQTTDFFINEKIDVILTKLWHFALQKLKLMKAPLKKDQKSYKKIDLSVNDYDDDEKLVIERLRLVNMDFSLKSILSKVTIQEPTFSRMIVLYRPASVFKNTSPFKNRCVHIMHFSDIPFADMELVLPEKRNPGLSPMDWLKFFITAVCGLAAVFSSIEFHFNLTVITAVLLGFVGYFAKLYFAWSASIDRYQELLARSMYSKHLDSGRGTLLHLEDEVIQQEVKEVILAYFVLMTTGKAQKADLDKRCENLMREEFNEKIDFEVEDALQKLEKLHIVKRNNLGFYTHLPLDMAESRMIEMQKQYVENHIGGDNH